MAAKPVIQNLTTTHAPAELVQGNKAATKDSTGKYFDNLCPPVSSAAEVADSNSCQRIKSMFEHCRSGITCIGGMTSELRGSGMTSELHEGGMTSGLHESGMTAELHGSGMTSELHGSGMTAEPHGSCTISKCGISVTTGPHWSGVTSEPHGRSYCPAPLQASQENPGNTAGGMLGGMGFLERRQHDHPDFKYHDLSGHRQVARFGIHPVIVLGTGNSVQ